MFKKFVVCMTVVVFAAGLLMAHGDPILGTVSAMDKDVMTIKDKDNKEVKIMLDAKTKYLLGTKAAKMSDIKVGTKVSIDAVMDTKMKMYVAESVTGPAATTASANAAPKAKSTAPATTEKKTPATK